MRGPVVGVGAAQIALGLSWLVLLWIDRGREPTKRRVPRGRLVWAVAGMWFVVTGWVWVVGGLGG